MQIFGDKESFAISYRPRRDWSTESTILVYCHLMLKGTIIGPDEVDMLGTCIGDLQRLRDKVSKNEGNFRDPLFMGLKDDEIMELIYKSNQLEDEYNPAYAYLPALKTNELWYKHQVTIAESTDHYALVVFEENGKLKFLWQKFEDRREGRTTLNSVLVDYSIFYSAINQFFAFVKQTYPDVLEWFDPQMRTTERL
jgi:hypothetical protein